MQAERGESPRLFRVYIGNAEEFSQRAAHIVTSYDITPYRNVRLLSEVAALKEPNESWDHEEPDAPLIWTTMAHGGF